jgi:putative tryptophan/tyrosine transport system substrate-binding protein
MACERFARLATELVDLHPDVIVASGPALPALKQITSSTPIVMAAASNPVIAGYVQSLVHPGGNITGLGLQSSDVTAKRLEILKELVQGPAPSMILWSGGDMQDLREAEAAARLRGWKLLTYEIRELVDLDAAIVAAKNARAGSLLVLAAGVLYPRARRVAELMADSHLPAMYKLRTTVDAGGLISYGPDINDVWERSALFVDKILRGTRPADLAVEQPTKFELVVNARAAKSLGLEIPQSLLLRAAVVLR